MGLLDNSRKSVYLDGRLIIEDVFIENKQKVNKTMEQNTSLSARIKRRNAQGFEGTGNYHGVGKNHVYGDYHDPKQNSKDVDYELDKRRKARLGFLKREYKFDATGNLMFVGRKTRPMSNKYADNRQRL